MAAEPILQSELWLSFVSLLRSYAAAASLNFGEVHVASTGNSATIGAGESSLEMNFDPETGHAAWQKHTVSHDPIAGSFEFQPEGTIAIGGAVKDLDHVAIEFVDLASRPLNVSGHNRDMKDRERNVKGHDFSRALTAAPNDGALAPEGSPKPSANPLGEKEEA